MQIKIHSYVKYKETLDNFILSINKSLHEYGYVKDFKLTENNYNSDIIFYFELEDKKHTSQELFVTGYHYNFDTLMAEINMRVSNGKSENKLVKYINILTLKGSPRLLGALIVEAGDKVKVESNGDKKKRRTKKKDEEADNTSKDSIV